MNEIKDKVYCIDCLKYSSNNKRHIEMCSDDHCFKYRVYDTPVKQTTYKDRVMDCEALNRNNDCPYYVSELESDIWVTIVVLWILAIFVMILWLVVHL